MAEQKLEPEKTWFRGHALAKTAVVGVVIGLAYARWEYRMDNQEKALLDVRNQLMRLDGETVSVRQFQSWIEYSHALNKEKFPEIVWPALPR